MIPQARDLHIARYRDWLDTQALLFGFGDELADYSNRARSNVLNAPPPVHMWHLIVPTIRLLERVREEFGPTVIVSAYRSPAYNESIEDSAKDSLHMHNKAVDFKCATGSPRIWAAYLEKLRREGAFKGGIGVYDTFVHVDTRGYNADWVG